MADDLTDGCLQGMVELLVEGFIAGTGAFVLSLFGKARDDGFLMRLFAYAIGLLVWIGLGYGIYWVSTLG